MEDAKGIMGTTPRTKTIRTRSKVLLIYGFQHFAQGILNPFILKAGKTDRSLLGTPSIFRDVYTTDRLVTVSLCPQPFLPQRWTLILNRPRMRPSTRGASEMDHRLSGAPGLLCGETRASQVTGWSLTYVPRSITPPGGVAPRPVRRYPCCLPSC